MRLHKGMYTVLIISLALWLSGAISGKDREDNIKANPSSRIPGLANKHLAAIGKRMCANGKEKTTYTGQLFDKNNHAITVRVLHDVFGPVRLEGFRVKDEALSFDGKRIKGSKDSKKIKGDAEIKAEEDLMEIFVMDNVEGMMESMRNGAAVQFYGSGIGPDPQGGLGYNGPRYDIYEVTTPVRCRKDQPLRTKMYFFDSNTGLLSLTRYTDYSMNPPVLHETRYTVWGDIEGSKYPARIEHYVDGRLQFDFITENIKNEESEDKSEY
jgi:hypothetical protein